MDLRQLRYFVAVAEELHFGRAARRLFISGPSLSQQVGQLERTLKLRLFDRDSRRVELTGAGVVLLGHARRALQVEADILTAMAQLRSEVQGTLHLGLLMGGAGDRTPALVQAFQAARPAVRVRLQNLSTTELVDPLVAGELDASVVWGPLSDPRIRTVPLFDEPRGLVVAERNELAGATLLDVGDLLGQRHGNRVEGEPPEWDGFWNLVPERGGEEPERVQVFASGDVVTQLYTLAHSDTALTLPRMMATVFPAANFGLRYVPVTGLAPATCSVALRADAPSELGACFAEVARLAVDGGMSDSLTVVREAVVDPPRVSPRA